jgi:hypothetical protein
VPAPLASSSYRGVPETTPLYEIEKLLTGISCAIEAERLAQPRGGSIDAVQRQYGEES